MEIKLGETSPEEGRGGEGKIAMNVSLAQIIVLKTESNNHKNRCI